MSFSSHNGVIIPDENLRLPVADRGLLFGDGVFTTLCVREGIVENLEKHLKRLERNCLAVRINPPKIDIDWIRELVLKNKAISGTWRLKLIVTGGCANRLDLHQRPAGDVIMTLSNNPIKPPIPYRLALFPFPVSSPTAHLKTLACLDRLWIRDYALSNHFHDALTTLTDGTTLETSFSNVFWIDDDILFTPSFELPLLKGNYLSTVIESASSNAYQIVEIKCTLNEIPATACVFVCNSMIGMHPIDSIEQTEFKKNPEIEAFLRNATQERIAADSLNIKDLAYS
jgi:4-amino-4-deoxychorismate lyase